MSVTVLVRMTVEPGFDGLMRSLNLDEPPVDISAVASFDLAQLAEAKRTIETQLDLLFDLLTSKYNADLDTPLVHNGFPRSDIDVVSVRLLRVRIIRLRNDHKQVLHHLDTKLASHFQSSTNTALPQAPPTIPFAYVKEIAPDGPAAASGLQEGDRVVSFGGVHVRNHDNLTAVARKVQQNGPIDVLVLRGTLQVTLHLTPSDDWPGRGRLGCRLVQL